MSLYPAGGFSSITLAYQSAETINVYSAGRFLHIMETVETEAMPAGILRSSQNRD